MIDTPTSAVRRFVARLLSPFRHRAADREVREEIAMHLSLAAAEYERQGLPPAEARRRAALALGGVDAARDEHRAARGLPTLDSVSQDLAYAVRGFRREPGFTAVAVLMLAIGIGANTAVFSVVNPLLLRPLPFRDASRLAWMADTREGGLSGVTYSVGVYEEIQRHARSFEEMTSYFAFFGYLSYTLTGSGHPERLSAVTVGPRFFEVLGVQPAIGRLFTKEELAQNGPKAVLLSHGLWQRRFAADTGIVGRTITIGAAAPIGGPYAYTVVGVMPASFDFASVFAPGQRVDMFMPAVFDDMRRWGNTLSVVARLKPGVSLDTAQAELAQLMPQLSEAHRDWGRREARLTALKQHVSGPISRSLLVLWGAVGLVILIVCTNLSNLMLARTTGRSREIALRMALGASRGRVMRQLLTEGVVLSLTGAGVGVGLAWLLTMWVRSSETLSLPLLSRVTVDGSALLFTAGLGCVAGLAFGALPALRISSRNPQDALREQSRGSTDGRRHAWVRGVLVAAEIALACVLLVGAGLLLRSFYELQQVDLGFRPSQVVAVRIDPNMTLKVEQQRAQLDEVSRAVAAIPSVEAVGFTDALPLDRNRSWHLAAVGRDRRPNEDLGPFVYVVGPGYFSAMGMQVKDGRDFTNDDTAERPGVVVVNETAARMLWRGESPVGRGAVTGDTPLQVIGVVADVRQTAIEEGGQPQMYLSYRQFGSAGSDLIVRSTLPMSALGPALRERVATVDRTLVAAELRPVGNLVERAISPRKFLLRLLGGFAAIAVLLACLGIYGLVSYTVNQRVQEIGVRMALGATASDVRRLVMGGTLRLAAVGLGLGLVAALLLARLITSLLYSTSPTDAGTFAATAVVLLLVALVASAVPAFRAARTNPLSALRAD
jgi:predicted permease